MLMGYIVVEYMLHDVNNDVNVFSFNFNMPFDIVKAIISVMSQYCNYDLRMSLSLKSVSFGSVIG